jgi:glutamate-ammonia-ligase adenylyltransferase
VNLYVETAQDFPAVVDEEAARVGMDRWIEGAERIPNEAEAAAASSIVSNPAGLAVLRGLFACSPFLTRLLLRDQVIATRILTIGPDVVLGEVMADLVAIDPVKMKTAQLMTVLRAAKRHVALAIAVADTLGTWVWSLWSLV